MYKLVFLLIFSAANVTGAKDITLDIDIKSETETSCQVTPAGTQTLTEGEHIQFHIQTPTKLNDFWCHNAEGKLVYNYETTELPRKHGKMKYTLTETNIDSKSDREGNWTCTYQILSKKSIAEKHESTCLFQATEIRNLIHEPGVSLNIAQLSQWTWKIQLIAGVDRTKIYNYSFTEGEKTFDCVLANPTEKEEKYTVSLKLDGSQPKRLQGVIMEPHSKTNLTGVFELNKYSKRIVCSAVNVKGVGPSLRTEIDLQYIPPRSMLRIAGPVTLLQSNDTIYQYNFTDGETLELNCSLNDAADFEKKYDITFYYSESGRSELVASSKVLKTTTHVWHEFTLNNESKVITCAAFDDKKEKSRIDVFLHYNPRPAQAPDGVKLNIEGLPDNSCNFTHKYKFTQVCNYPFNDSDLIGPRRTLKCVLRASYDDKTDFNVTFGTNTRIVTFEANDSSPKIVSYGIPLNSEDNTVRCTAFKNTSSSFIWTIDVNVHYIPQSTSTSSTSTATTTLEPLTMEPSSLPGWVQWVLGGGAVLIIIYVVGGCLVMRRQKKPPPADSTYANLTKDQNKSTPGPAPRTIQKTNDAQKPNAASKPNVTLDNNYSEPKDSQDMSEALYADPNRFVGDSSNYAEPYVAKPSAPSKLQTYAEPYKSNYAEPYPCTSEGNYAELDLPDCSGKDLYAKPIPKAQRKPKVKDDCNYSYVFGGQYGNTKK